MSAAARGAAGWLVQVAYTPSAKGETFAARLQRMQRDMDTIAGVKKRDLSYPQLRKAA